MNSKQSSIVAMAKQVFNVLEKNETIVSELADLASLQVEIGDILTEIDETNSKVQQDITKFAKTKTELREQAAQDIIDLNTKVYAYALITNNTTLLSKTNFTLASLQKLPDSEFVASCRMILTAATDNKDVLVKYKVTTETIATVQTSFTAFVDEMNKPREVRTEQKQYTAQLTQKVNELPAILEKTDALVQMVKTEHAAFYKLYNDAREIHYHHGSLAVQVTVKDSKTGTGIAGVKASFVSEGTEVLVKTTFDGGGFNIKSLEQGTYAVTFSVPGYVTQTVTIYVVEAQSQSVEVALVHV